MASLLRGVFGERSLTKLAGLYGERAAAERAALEVTRAAGLQPAQVRILGPEDAHRSHREWFSRSVEPETGGIFRTLLRTHLVLGVVGAVAGVLLYATLVGTRQAMVVGSPLLSFIAIVGFATTFGLMAGGLLSLRPDHTLLINQLRTGLKGNRWAVVVHPTDERQVQAAREALQASGAKVLATF